MQCAAQGSEAGQHMRALFKAACGFGAVVYVQQLTPTPA
jgi:hypothetical protein